MHTSDKIVAGVLVDQLWSLGGVESAPGGKRYAGFLVEPFFNYNFGHGWFAIKEIKEALPAMVFFAIGFNLIVLTTQLILDDYGAQLAGFLVATTTALVVGKAVLLAKLLPFFGRFDNAPLVQPIVFKTFVYWAVVFVARFLEKLIEYLFHGGRIGGIPDYVTEHFTWHRFGAIQIWIFVLFLIYVTADELNTLFGMAVSTRSSLRVARRN